MPIKNFHDGYLTRSFILFILYLIKRMCPYYTSTESSFCYELVINHLNNLLKNNRYLVKLCTLWTLNFKSPENTIKKIYENGNTIGDQHRTF